MIKGGINVEDLQPLTEQETEDLKLLLQRAIEHEQLMLFAQKPDENGEEMFCGNGVYASDSFSVLSCVSEHDRLVDPADPLGEWEEYHMPEVHIGLPDYAIDILYGSQEFIGDVDMPKGIGLTARMVEAPCVQNQ